MTTDQPINTKRTSDFDVKEALADSSVESVPLHQPRGRTDDQHAIERARLAPVSRGHMQVARDQLNNPKKEGSLVCRSHRRTGRLAVRSIIVLVRVPSCDRRRDYKKPKTAVFEDKKSVCRARSQRAILPWQTC